MSDPASAHSNKDSWALTMPLSDHRGGVLHRMQRLDDWVGLRLVCVGTLYSVPPPLHADLHQLLLLHVVRDLCELHIESSQCYQWRSQLLHRK